MTSRISPDHGAFAAYGAREIDITVVAAVKNLINLGKQSN